MNEKTIIELKNVSKSYSDTIVLNNYNLKIESGEFISVLGPSGCGKTTVLKLINGLLKPDSGQVFVENVDISTINQNLLRRHIGYVIQSIGLFPHMTIAENIAYVPKLLNLSKEEIKERTHFLIKLLDLEENSLDRFPHQLSGGQKQRVGIARALGGEPKILLMDEPFSAVDEITRKGLQDEIKFIQKEKNLTILFITHDVSEAFKLGSKVMIMNKGKIQQFEEPAIIQNNPANDFIRTLIHT